ncbi:hypothetical protein Hanom_Chr09g00793641 [Helianthus anomalus]
MRLESKRKGEKRGNLGFMNERKGIEVQRGRVVLLLLLLGFLFVVPSHRLCCCCRCSFLQRGSVGLDDGCGARRKERKQDEILLFPMYMYGWIGDYLLVILFNRLFIVKIMLPPRSSSIHQLSTCFSQSIIYYF